MAYTVPSQQFKAVSPSIAWKEAAYSGQPAFALLNVDKRLVGYGRSDQLRSGPAETLGQRVREFFRTDRDASILVGALPFDRHAPDHLVSAEQLCHALPRLSGARPQPRRRWSIQDERPASDYATAVRRGLELMQADPGLRKVVLARTLLAEADQAIDLTRLLHELHTDASVTAFLVPLPHLADGSPRSLVGATPELLVARTGRAVVSHPLAGSARRSEDAAADEAACRSLRSSEKDTREHALVVDFILDVLAPHCRALAAPDRGAIRATGTMWHLGTRIEGELRDPDLSAADLAALLHPTPAVCGVPRERAAALIPELESVDRGFYAGAVGWCDRHGDGAWHVSIRCAEIAGRRARLYAGAGIVPGSQPDAEVAETAAKFRAMLHALGVDEQENVGMTKPGLPRIPTYALPHADELPPSRAKWAPERSRAALLIHDMQRYFVGAFTPDTAPIAPVVENIRALAGHARAADIPVFYTAQDGDQDQRDRGLQAHLWGKGMSARTDHQPILAELTPEDGDIVLVKHRYNAFQRSNLETLMRVRGRDQLIICGVYAHIGCLLTAADAFMRDIEPFYVADGVADFSREKHDMALRYVADTCGVLCTTRPLIDAL